MKTLAFLLMLIHHLWREPSFARFEPVAYGNILLSIGLMSKICVGIFMFLSGYGLMASTISGGAKLLYHQSPEEGDVAFLVDCFDSRSFLAGK